MSNAEVTVLRLQFSFYSDLISFDKLEYIFKSSFVYYHVIREYIKRVHVGALLSRYFRLRVESSSFSLKWLSWYLRLVVLFWVGMKLGHTILQKPFEKGIFCGSWPSIYGESSGIIFILYIINSLLTQYLKKLNMKLNVNTNKSFQADVIYKL